MAALGWKEGLQFIIEARWTEGHPERLQPLAKELVALSGAIQGRSTVGYCRHKRRDRARHHTSGVGGCARAHRALERWTVQPGATTHIESPTDTAVARNREIRRLGARWSAPQL